MIYGEEGEQILSADDVFLYSRYSARLYMDTNLATADNLQFLFQEATTTGKGVLLWKLIIGINPRMKICWMPPTSCGDGQSIQVSISNLIYII